MGEVVRMFPGAVNGLINWMEHNFHDIESFVITLSCKDGTTMTVYHVNNYVEALGLIGVSQNTINQLAENNELVTKGGGSDDDTGKT